MKKFIVLSLISILFLGSCGNNKEKIKKELTTYHDEIKKVQNEGIDKSGAFYNDITADSSEQEMLDALVKSFNTQLEYNQKVIDIIAPKSYKDEGILDSKIKEKNDLLDKNRIIFLVVSSDGSSQYSEDQKKDLEKIDSLTKEIDALIDSIIPKV